jgi:hypothetical protein
MTKVQKIIKIIEEQLRMRPFKSQEIFKITGFHSGGFLDHLVKLGILGKEKEEGVRFNTYMIGPEWTNRHEILNDLPERKGYSTDVVWTAIESLSKMRGDFTIEELRVRLKSNPGMTPQRIRNVVNSLVLNGAVAPTGRYSGQFMIYRQISKTRPKIK